MGLFSRKKRIDDYDKSYSTGEVDIFGVKMGEWKFYDRKDILTKTMIYTQENKSPFKLFYRNGKLKEEGTFVSKERYNDGERIWIRDGECRLYYETGELHTIYHNKVCGYSSTKEGPLTSYYKTGEVLRTCNLKDSLILGPHTICNKDGSIKSQDIYKERYNSSIIYHFRNLEDIMKINEEI
jgi:hypothetical protein